MNSVLQCLSNTRPVLDYVISEEYTRNINTTTSSMNGALIKGDFDEIKFHSKNSRIHSVIWI